MVKEVNLGTRMSDMGGANIDIKKWLRKAKSVLRRLRGIWNLRSIARKPRSNSTTHYSTLSNMC